MNAEQLERLAVEILDTTGLKAPVNALVLAAVFGLRPIPVGPYDEGRHGDEIRFNGRAPYRDRQDYIASSAARWAIMQEGHYATEASTRRLARALMLPRACFLADLSIQRELAWLLLRQPHASSAMICARLGDVGVKVRAIRRGHASYARPARVVPAASEAPVAMAEPLPQHAYGSQRR